MSLLSSLVRTALLPVSLLVATAAHADAVSVSLKPKGAAGQELPSISLHIQEPIAGFWLKLNRAGGGKIDVKGGGAPGVTRTIDLTQPVGKFAYTGELRINLPNGEVAKMPLEFEAELFDPLVLTLDEKDVDLAGRKLAFKLSRPAGKAKVTVLMDTGLMVMDTEVPFSGEPAGTLLPIEWPAAPGKVMKISIEGYDTSNFGKGVELSPWQIDIPHEEVHFDTGKADIRADQKAKLDDSHRKVADAVAKYGHIAKVRLYILGHTDTQGGTQSNRTLSLQRARSIGNALRSRGLRIPVFYEGFGEEALKVKTADETDEAQNRRADYVLALEPPRMEQVPFPPNWKKL